MRRFSLAAALGILLVVAALPPVSAAPASPMTASDVLQELRNFREFGSVLYVAAHPDDENNRLLPYLARGRALRTAYLSLTRGDGGQNLIGPELGDPLGVIRTQELLAARRIDGAQQFFSRARDFGFSKDAADTLRRWHRDEVVADIVRVIRTFRPDVIVTRFSPVPGGTHGHHTASAILTLEAFKLAGDPKAFPEQLGHLPPWQPKRVLWNSWSPSGTGPAGPGVVQLDAGGYDPLLGESFGEIGARGRSMHKSQGEGRTGTRGRAFENFTLLAGEPAGHDIMDGVEPTWARIPGGAGLATRCDEVLANFDPLHPEKSVPALLAIRREMSALQEHPLLADKRAQLDRVLQACLGLHVETTLPNAQVVPGETLHLRHTAIVRTGVPVRWIGVRYPAQHRELGGAFPELPPDAAASRESAVELPVSTPLTQPYWLRGDGTEGMFEVADAALIGRAENPPAFPVEFVFDVGGQTLVVRDEPVQVITDPVNGEVRRPLEAIAPISVAWSDELALFAPGETRTVSVELSAARAHTAGELRLESPAGWRVAPTQQAFQLNEVGDRAVAAFQITAPAAAGSARFVARATIGDRSYDRGRSEIRYPHIPVQLLQRPAVLHAVSLEVATRARAIGYLPGAGDLVAESLARLGCTVTPLGSAEVTADRLQRFDAIVLGVRAFNVRGDLDALMPALFAYAERGGTLIVQYNTSNGLASQRFAPYPLELSRERITNADAPVTLLAPDHAAFTTPNRITAADFTGWVQERARFVPKSWGAQFTPLLAMNDPGESPLEGTLLVAKHGRGHIVYTSLSWFRELPAGVPGAYRLFANLLSLGK